MELHNQNDISSVKPLKIDTKRDKNYKKSHTSTREFWGGNKCVIKTGLC